MHEQVIIFKKLIVPGQIWLYRGSNEESVSFISSCNGEDGVASLAEVVIEVHEIALAVFISMCEGKALYSSLQLQYHAKV